MSGRRTVNRARVGCGDGKNGSPRLSMRRNGAMSDSFVQPICLPVSLSHAQLSPSSFRSNRHAISRGLLVLVRTSVFNGARSTDLVQEFVSIQLLERTACRVHRRWLSRFDLF